MQFPSRLDVEKQGSTSNSAFLRVQATEIDRRPLLLATWPPDIVSKSYSLSLRVFTHVLSTIETDIYYSQLLLPAHILDIYSFLDTSVVSTV